MREISPLDGRYRDRLAPLGEFFSEFALVQARLEVELRYLIALDEAETGLFQRLASGERGRMDELLDGLSETDFERVKAIESEIRHDVKSCEVFLRHRLDLSEPERIHFGLTSADINNLAYGLILKQFRDEVQLPQLKALVATLADMAQETCETPFPARTHGQMASPSTAGKELAVFVDRLVRQGRQLGVFSFRGKLTGATGTFAAFHVVDASFDWLGFSKRFVESLGLEPHIVSTQIDDGDALAEYFDLTARIHRIVLDLDLDCWEYLSRGELIQRAVAGEVGSSTMPHKVNPIRFENSEGNLTIANALLRAFSEKLSRSRMQRDLSDTTVRRNIGVALAHGHLAIGETLRGLDEITVNESLCRKHIDAVPAVLTEAVQTVLRVEGIENAYERLREATRGQTLSLADLHVFIDGLEIAGAVKERLKALRPFDYVGLAPEICRCVVEEARAWLAES